MSKKSRGKADRSPSRPPIELAFQRVKSTYTVREISQLFGLSPRLIRRWTREGMIQPVTDRADGKSGVESAAELRYDFRALTVLRKVRELRAAGLTVAQIDAHLCGQMNLFDGGQGQLLVMPQRLSPFEQALALHERNDPSAKTSYYKAIQAGDFVADAYCNLGILAFESGEMAKAADCFTLSLKNDPRHFESHFNLANLYFEQGDLRLAALHFEIAREIEPSFADLQFNFGVVYLEQQRYGEAIRAFRKWLEVTDAKEKVQVEQLLSKLEDLIQ